jgi:hypothetical protein
LQNELVGKKNKLTSMKDEYWEDFDARALNTICFYLEDEVLFNIVEEVKT